MFDLQKMMKKGKILRFSDCNCNSLIIINYDKLESNEMIEFSGSWILDPGSSKCFGKLNDFIQFYKMKIIHKNYFLKNVHLYQMEKPVAFNASLK